MDDSRIDWEGWRKSIERKEKTERRYLELMIEAHPALKKMANAAWMLPKENSDPRIK